MVTQTLGGKVSHERKQVALQLEDLSSRLQVCLRPTFEIFGVSFWRRRQIARSFQIRGLELQGALRPHVLSFLGPMAILCGLFGPRVNVSVIIIVLASTFIVDVSVVHFKCLLSLLLFFSMAVEGPLDVIPNPTTLHSPYTVLVYPLYT